MLSSTYAAEFSEQVHPDKCSCFGAEEAFQFLKTAVSELQSKGEGGFLKTNTETHTWWEAWEGAESREKRKRKWEGEQQEEVSMYFCEMKPHHHSQAHCSKLCHTK